MTRRAWAAALWIVVFGACVETVMVPARPSGPLPVASAQALGVTVWAEFQWSGDPPNLREYVTPVLVTVENHSGRAVRLAYQDFSLLGSSGTRYAALPPFSVAPGVSERSVEQPIVLADFHPAAPARPAPPPPPRHVTPRIHHRGFHVAPPYAHFYVGLPLWAGLWAFNAGYYARWSASWPTRLPTADMLERALPEGALEDGGRVTGHLYFQNVHREAAVEFTAALHDAQTGQDVATISLPFVMR